MTDTEKLMQQVIDAQAAHIKTLEKLVESLAVQAVKVSPNPFTYPTYGPLTTGGFTVVGPLTTELGGITLTQNKPDDLTGGVVAKVA